MLHLVSTFLVPILGAGAIFLLPSRTQRLTVLLATTLAHLCLTARLWLGAPEAGSSALLGVDASGLLFLSVISLLYCLVAVHLVAYTRRDSRGAPKVFLACHLLSLSAMTVATLSAHWGLFWVAMEATTLATAPLLFYHHGPRALEATWKYLLICSVGIALALLGTFFLGMASASLAEGGRGLGFASMVDHAGGLSTPWLKMGAVFLIVGYGTKMGLAPMHTWKPDAYGEAPPPVAALLSGGLTNCAFLGILRVSQLCTAAGQGPFVRSMLVALGLLSIGIAAASILGQGNYRRLLAYSSVEHMGILVLGIGIGGLAAFGALLHAVNNAFNKGILFLAAGNVLQARGTSESKSVTGLLKTMPVTGVFMILGFLAATGIPPFGTFISEFTILRGMIASGGAVVPVLYLGFLAIVFIGMGSSLLEMVQGVPQGPPPEPRHGVDSFAAILPMAIFTLVVLLLGIWIPGPLQAVLEHAAGLTGGAR
jgi:hydrogenase-4 component F